MKNKIKIILTVVSLFILQAVSASDTTKVIILHTNDVHGRINNYSKIKYISDSLRNIYSNVFMVSAGDIFSGNPIVDKHSEKGYPIIDLMNILDYKVSVLGNHEFDYGQEILNDRVLQAKFDFICANVKTSPLAKIKQPKPYVVLHTNDSISLFFLGELYISKNKLPETHPSKLTNMVFYKPEKSIKKYKSESKSYDAFILLSHLGYDLDKKVAQSNKEIDLIIGGHSHTRLYSGEKVNSTLITQAGSKLMFLGKAELTFVNKELISITDTLIDLKGYKNTNLEAEKIIKKYNNDRRLLRVVGTAEKQINNKELGSLMAKSQREVTGADFAIQNTGGVRIKSIAKGNITIGDVYRLDPFNNEIVILNLNYKEIISLVKYSFSLDNRINYIPAGLIIDNKINDGKLSTVILKDLQGNILDKKKKYKVAINSYMSISYKFKGNKNHISTGKTSNQCILQYLKDHKKIGNS